MSQLLKLLHSPALAELVLVRPMKAFLILLAILGLAGFAIWQHTTIAGQNQRLAALTQEVERLRPPRATSRPKPTKNYTRRIACPLCHGEGIVVYDSGGKNDPMNRRSENCPVCLGRGYREVAVMPTQKICPDCKGMGLVWSAAPRHPTRVANCARCGSTGVITSLK